MPQCRLATHKRVSKHSRVAPSLSYTSLSTHPVGETGRSSTVLSLQADGQWWVWKCCWQLKLWSLLLQQIYPLCGPGHIYRCTAGLRRHSAGEFRPALCPPFRRFLTLCPLLALAPFSILWHVHALHSRLNRRTCSGRYFRSGLLVRSLLLLAPWALALLVRRRASFRAQLFPRTPCTTVCWLLQFGCGSSCPRWQLRYLPF